jgi:hypothetical protein
MKLRPVTVSFGGDPELFLERGGEIIGSEHVIPRTGLKDGASIYPSVVRDGVQVELNPRSSGHVSVFAQGISTAFEMLARAVKKVPGVSISFREVVEVSREELDSLCVESRILGCKPSFNFYGTRPIGVDPATFRGRSAGGHLHFGLLGSRQLFKERINLVPLFDIFVGNTCVMLNREPLAAVRRENYGRAGEYRTPKYGIEYRTLSNFWLRNYALTDLVYGLGSIALSVYNHRLSEHGDIEAEVVEAINIDQVAEAINTNNFDLARANFERVRPFLSKHLPQSQEYPLNPNTIDRFLTFVDGVEKQGLNTFFPQHPVDHWVERNFVGFNEFLSKLY